jgi:hypothetical protein
MPKKDGGTLQQVAIPVIKKRMQPKKNSFWRQKSRKRQPFCLSHGIEYIKMPQQNTAVSSNAISKKILFLHQLKAIISLGQVMNGEK